jgi:hypothetical protein
MSDPSPTRTQRDLADVVETLLDKGVVINADIAVSIGDTELLGIQLRAALASFETAAEYGLEFPEGTDMQRVAEASGREPLDEHEDKPTAEDVMALHKPLLTERTLSSTNAPNEEDAEDNSTPTEHSTAATSPESDDETTGRDMGGTADTDTASDANEHEEDDTNDND